MDKSLLVIGRPNASKTVFITQLHSRLQKRKGELKLDIPVNDLSPIKSSREALANGEEPQSSYGSKSAVMEFSAIYGSTSIQLSCPDYGGEQIDNILSNREVDPAWKKAITNSDSWLFLIRLTSMDHALDLSTTTIDPSKVVSNVLTEPPYEISDQTGMIETLQIFLDVKKNDYHRRNKNVKLTIALSCWDELNTTLPPQEILKNQLPLFFDFITTTWVEENLNIWGLSAQGFSLEPEENKEKYQNFGPENYGYIVNKDGKEIEDWSDLIICSL